MEIVTILIVLVYQFYFYMHQSIKLWLFEKIIFLDSLRFHTVLKLLSTIFYQIFIFHQMIAL